MNRPYNSRIFIAMKRLFFVLCSVFLISGAACSIQISQEVPPTQNAPEPANVLSPTTIPGANPTPSLPTIQIPVTWASLNLTGRLVYISAQVENNAYVLRIRALDLVTGIITTIYEAPLNSWIYYVSVSPDNLQLIMSYSPPHAQNPDIIQAIYTLPMDGSQPPRLLIQPPTPEDQFMQAEWSPDGKYIYYVHVNYRLPQDPNRINPLFELFRMAYPGGPPEKIADKAYWPRLSPDSTRLLYVVVDPFALLNKLIIADANGANAREVVVTDAWNPNIKDAPIFAPDGQSIIFSAASNVQSNGPNWLDQFMGIKAARADGTIPSEWWSVPINGGQLTQLTRIQSIGLFASLSPDHTHIASASGSGILVMKVDGSELTLLLPDETSSGTVSWIP